MRIVHVLDHTLQFNGMVHAAVDLACAQAALGCEVMILSGDRGSFDHLLTTSGVRLVTLAPAAKRFGRTRRAFGLYRAIRAFAPDVVHTHMVRSTILSWPITRLLRIPLVTCVQNSFSRFAPVMRLGDRVITGCQAVADDMARRGIPRGKLRPILNGTIGSARRPAARVTPAPLRRPAVITMCGLHYRKGVEYLIRGFEAARESHPELHLYILGEGPNEAEYRAMVSAAHRDRIHFCGAVADPRSHLAAADVFVLASVLDPAPLAIAEAREAGLAVIGTRVDGIPELLENGKAGILVDPRSPDQIADAIRSLFADPAALDRWRRNSQVQIDRLSVRRVAEQTVAVYRECLGAQAATLAIP